MGCSAGPEIRAISNGAQNLVVAVDVSNLKCFNGSNTATLTNLANTNLNFTGGSQVNSDRIQGHYNDYYRTPVSNVLDTDYHSIFFKIRFNATGTYPDAWSGNWDQIFAFNGSGDRVPGIWRFPSERKIHWRYNPGNSGCDFGDNSTFAVNTWYFIGATKNGPDARMYINGNNVGTATVSNPKTTGSSDIRLFGPYTGQKVDIASLNNLYVFNRVISDDEVKNLFETMRPQLGI